MRLVVLSVLTLIFTGCTEDVKSVKTEWFDIPGLSNQLVRSMGESGPQVHKKIEFNGISESRQIDFADTSFWKQELAKVTETNLNSPLVRDYIELKSSSQDNYSNLKVDHYTIDSESKSLIKEVLIYYLDVPSEIRQISIRLNESNLVFQSETEIDLWLNRYQNLILIDSINVNSHEKTILQAPRVYTNKIAVLW